MSDEYTVHLQVETLPEGQFLATSEDLPGLVAQGRTVAETVEIASDVARKLLESYREHGDPVPAGVRPVADRFEVDVTISM